MSTLKKIFITILFLSVISLTPILKVNALDLNSSILSDLESHLSSNFGSNSCSNVTLFQMGANDYTWYLCSSQYENLQGTINTNLINGSRVIDLRTNFYGIESLRVCWTSGSCGTYRFTGSGYYNPSTNAWVRSCTASTCPYSQSIPETATYHNGYIVGVFNRLGNNSDYNIIYQNANSQLFYNNYNLLYYETPVDYFGSYTNTFSQPDNVKGSMLDFSGDELTANILDFSYSYINSYMYSFNDIDNEDTLISHQYNYSSPDLTGNYKLGFVITKKTYNDVPFVVHAVTNTGSWACNSITPLKNKNDYNYQFYVECPSVNFSDTDDDYLKIVVNGSSEFYQITGPFTWYDTNYLFQDNNNNKYVGISSILRIATDTPPVPVTPDDTTPDNTIDAINNMNNNIMDPTGPDTSSLSNSAGWLPAGPVDSIINLPITMLSSLNNVLTNSTCSPISVPIPFINFNYSLPCLSTIISNMGFATWWEWVGTIASAFVLYKYLINLYAWVDKTLTFRENNWNDWGGI